MIRVRTENRVIFKCRLKKALCETHHSSFFTSRCRVCLSCLWFSALPCWQLVSADAGRDATTPTLVYAAHSPHCNTEYSTLQSRCLRSLLACSLRCLALWSQRTTASLTLKISRSFAGCGLCAVAILFRYTGQGPDAYVYGFSEEFVDGVPPRGAESFQMDMLPQGEAYDGDTLSISLPENVTWNDIRVISIWYACAS